MAEQTAAAPVQNIENVPSVWPGAFGLYKHSKAVVLSNWQTLLLLTIVALALGSVLEAVIGKTGQVLGQLISFIFAIASTSTYLAAVRGGKLSIGEALKTCTVSLFFRYLLASILFAFIVGLSLVLLIVPFFFVFPRLLLYQYFVVDRRLGPIQALQASWDATKGHAGMIWGIIGASIAMGLLCITIIGIPFSLYFLFMYSASTVIAYEFVNKTAAANAPALNQ